MNDSLYYMKKDISSFTDYFRKENISMTHLSDLYKQNFTNYDIILSDISFKSDKAMKIVDELDSSKANKRQIIPKLAKLEREIANIRVRLNKDPSFM